MRLVGARCPVRAWSAGGGRCPAPGWRLVDGRCPAPGWRLVGAWRSASGWRDTYSAYGLNLNDRSEVLGSSHTIEGVVRPFLWRRGVTTDLTTRGLTSSDSAVALNDRGQLAGARGGRPALFR